LHEEGRIGRLNIPTSIASTLQLLAVSNYFDPRCWGTVILNGAASWVIWNSWIFQIKG